MKYLDVPNNVNTTNSEMDWNDAEFYKLCEELEDANNLFNVNNNKVSDSIGVKNGNHQQSSNYLANDSDNLILNDPTENILNFSETDQVHSFILHNNSNDNNNIINANNNININCNSNNTVMPWELVESDFTHISNYLHSPAV